MVPFVLELVLFLCVLVVFIYLFQLQTRKFKVIEKPKQLEHETENIDFTQWQLASICVVYVLINLIIVIGANAAYVYLVTYGNSSDLVYEQISLSIFKLIWNKSSSMLLNSVSRLHSSNPTAVDSDFSMQFLGLRIIMVALVNNILIPLVVVMCISPSCFYNVFVAAPDVQSTYNTYFCFVNEGPICVDYVAVPETNEFSPPFSYSYECSSSFITYYSPIFVSMCIFSTLVVPGVMYSLYQLHQHGNGSSLDVITPGVLKSGNWRKGVQGHFGEIVLFLSTVLGMLLTFGVVYPPLGIALVVVLVVCIYRSRIQLGRFVGSGLDAHLIDQQTFGDIMCDGMLTFEVLDDLLWMLVTVACIFYTLLLFDTLGSDASVGFHGAYWVLIVMPLLPLVLRVVFSAVGIAESVTLAVDEDDGEEDGVADHVNAKKSEVALTNINAESDIDAATLNIMHQN